VFLNFGFDVCRRFRQKMRRSFNNPDSNTVVFSEATQYFTEGFDSFDAAADNNDVERAFDFGKFLQPLSN
jgi:hypothetical protein